MFCEHGKLFANCNVAHCLKKAAFLYVRRNTTLYLSTSIMLSVSLKEDI